MDIILSNILFLEFFTLCLLLLLLLLLLWSLLLSLVVEDRVDFNDSCLALIDSFCFSFLSFLSFFRLILTPNSSSRLLLLLRVVLELELVVLEFFESLLIFLFSSFLLIIIFIFLISCSSEVFFLFNSFFFNSSSILLSFSLVFLFSLEWVISFVISSNFLFLRLLVVVLVCFILRVFVFSLSCFY